MLDLLLPDINGFEVCRRLRAQGNWTPVLILTAKDGEFDLAEALDTGADDFLSKPFSFVVLVRPAAGDHPPGPRAPAAAAALRPARPRPVHRRVHGSARSTWR